MTLAPSEKTISTTKISLYDLFYASKTQKTYTNLGVALTLTILLLVFALVPTIQKLDTVREQIDLYERLNSDVKQKIETAQILENQIARTSVDSPSGMKDEIEYGRKAFLSPRSIDILFFNLYKRASDNNVQISSFTPKINDETLLQNETLKSSPTTTYFEVNLTANAQSYTDLVNFINSLEGYKNMPIVSRVKDLSITDVVASNQLANQQKQQENNDKTTSSATNTADTQPRFTLNISLAFYTLKL